MPAMNKKDLLAWLRRLPFVGERLGDRLDGTPTVAVLRLDGVIGGRGLARRGLNLAGMADAIERAFKLRHLSAVALAVNSPGGSPVQSALIAGRIRALAEEKEIPVYAFCEDAAASGGYWLACAGDEIYAQGASIVGSIGVVSAGFGFPDMLAKIGVERRVHTSGVRKAILDPFRPENPDDVDQLKEIQEDVHEQFIEFVRARRGDRLDASDDVLFSGEFWTGRRALALGLIDGIGDLRGVMRDKFGEKVRLRVVGGRRGWLERRFGLNAVDALLDGMEARALWWRFGL
jgi:signal peptide peptidase SppA